jgi:kumamolisin
MSLKNGQHVVLEGSKRCHRASAEVLGRSDSGEWCEVTVKVRRKKALPEPVAGKAVLSYEQAVKNHGASPEDMANVSGVLSGYGVAIVSTNPFSRTVKIAGPVSAMEKAFQVHLFRVKHQDRVYRGRVGDILVPARLDKIITGVFGLDTRPMIRRRNGFKSTAPSQLPPAGSRPWFTPQELAARYNFPPNDGSGQTVGIIELGGSYIPGDLQQFAGLVGFTAPQVQVIQVETLSQGDSSDPDAIGEVMLDIEVVAGVCPGANIAVYFSNFTEQGWIDAIDAALNDTKNKPSVLSISYGLAEGTDIWTGQAMTAVNDAMQEAATRGIPVCVAAGDDGSDDQVQDGLAHVDFPSSSPYVLCVGGTSLAKNGPETVWFEYDGLRRDGGGSTGGGVSNVFPRPAWQNSIAISSVNPNHMDGRCVPDVAANAAGGTGYFMVSQGAPAVSGGTSAAAPLWAGLIARLNKAGKPVQYATPLFYQSNPRTNNQPLGSLVCNDITQGNNDTAAAGGYSAGSGYDAVTGWGSPNGANLLNYL